MRKAKDTDLYRMIEFEDIRKACRLIIDNLDGFTGLLSKEENVIFKTIALKWTHKLKEHKDKVIQDMIDELSDGKPYIITEDLTIGNNHLNYLEGNGISHGAKCILSQIIYTKKTDESLCYLRIKGMLESNNERDKRCFHELVKAGYVYISKTKNKKIDKTT